VSPISALISSLKKEGVSRDFLLGKKTNDSQRIFGGGEKQDQAIPWANRLVIPAARQRGKIHSYELYPEKRPLVIRHLERGRVLAEETSKMGSHAERGKGKNLTSNNEQSMEGRER